MGGEYGTALQAAALGGDQEIVSLLLDKGADVNAEGGKYGTALLIASYGRHQEIVSLLLEKGAVPMLRVQWHSTSSRTCQNLQILDHISC